MKQKYIYLFLAILIVALVAGNDEKPIEKSKKWSFFGLFSKKTSIAKFDRNGGICLDPRKARAEDCIPFRTIRTKDSISRTIFLKTITGLVKCSNIFPKKPDKLAQQLYFHIYTPSAIDNNNNKGNVSRNANGNEESENKHVKIVRGDEFIRNTDAYFVQNPTTCVKVLMGGIMTDCGQTPETMANVNDWRTQCAKNLIKHKMCTVIVVNWGTKSCNNYLCLVAFLMKPLGQLLGNLFYEKFNLKTLHLIGHSLGAHIFGYACETVKSKSSPVQQTGFVQIAQKAEQKIVYMFTALDVAGPLIRDNKIWYMPGFFKGGVSPDIAEKTIAFYTNPGWFGSKNFKLCKVNVLVNRDTKFAQPGTNGKLYNHMFAVALTAAMSDYNENTKCLGDEIPDSFLKRTKNAAVKFFTNNAKKTNLNFFYNDNIPDGTYSLPARCCYPFCCQGKKY